MANVEGEEEEEEEEGPLLSYRKLMTRRDDDDDVNRRRRAAATADWKRGEMFALALTSDQHPTRRAGISQQQQRNLARCTFWKVNSSS